MTRFDCIFIYVDIKTMDKILQITIEIDYLMLMAYKYFFLLSANGQNAVFVIIYNIFMPVVDYLMLFVYEYCL